MYHAALERPEEQRAAFVAEACAGDDGLRQELASLLACEAEAAAFLEHNSQSDLTDHPLPPRRQDAFVWVAWATTVLVVIAFSYAAWLLAARGGEAAAFGWTEVRRGDHWYVARVQPNGPAAGTLRPGDRVIVFNGRVPGPRGGTVTLRRRLRPRDSYELLIHRDGVRRAVRLQAWQAPDALASRITWALVALVWCGVGLAIGLARPQQLVARLAFAAAIATGLVFLQVGIIQRGPLWQPLHVVVGCHFFCLFPRGVPPGRHIRPALWILYLTGGLSLALTHWLRWTASLAPDALVRPGLFASVADVLGLTSYAGATLLMIAAIPLNYRLLSDDDQRRRVRWVAGASAVALAPQLWDVTVRTINAVAGTNTLAVPGLSVNIFTVVVPISTAYAILKHRVLGLRVVVRRGVQYVLARRALQVVVAVPVVALTWTLIMDRHRTVAELVTLNSGYVYWGAVAGLALRFRRPLRRALDRRFFREDYDRERALLALVDDMPGATSVPELSRMVTAHLESAFHPDAVHLFYRERDDFTLGHSSDPPVRTPAFPSGGALRRQLERARVPLDGPRSGARLYDADEIEWLAELGAELIVPIMDSTEILTGVLVLGEKRSEEPYTAADRRLLQAIARQAAVVRETLQLRAEVEVERRIRHDVLERLDGAAERLLRECPACGTCCDGTADRCDADGHALVVSLPVARTIDGKYRLDRRIGRGGMGAVYEARDLRLDRTVAVKVMVGRAFGEHGALRRFQREARAAARLDHANIVTMHDFGGLDGEGAYFVMERLYGETLRQRLDRAGALDPPEAAVWFDQVLDGMAAAHARGVVHRDLKPENIIAEPAGDGTLRVKVLDFGLAKVRVADAALSTSVSVGGVVLGTLGYMPPEQLLGREVDHRADIFAVAVMVVEALTRRRPYDEDTYAALLTALLREQPCLPDALPGWTRLNELLRRCLARNPADRPQTAVELRRELVAALLRCPPSAAGVTV